jgi:hypothetical protein
MAEVLSHQEEVAAIRESIEMIPRAMRHMGWRVSAEMMERWLRSPAWVLPDTWKSNNPPDPRSLAPAQLDQRSVRMNWAMSNPRVRVAMEELRGKMANGPARKNLRDRVDKLLRLPGQSVRFGSQSDSAVQLDQTCQSNWVAFGGALDTMDDLYGGIGKATLKVALIGEARRDTHTGKSALRVTHAGFYIRDTYDFSGHQYLGEWTESGVQSKTEMIATSVIDGLSFRWGKPPGHRSNYDFQTYRRLTGRGGDFVLYSDVYWEHANLLLDLS